MMIQMPTSETILRNLNKKHVENIAWNLCKSYPKSSHKKWLKLLKVLSIPSNMNTKVTENKTGLRNVHFWIFWSQPPLQTIVSELELTKLTFLLRHFSHIWKAWSYQNYKNRRSIIFLFWRQLALSLFICLEIRSNLFMWRASWNLWLVSCQAFKWSINLTLLHALDICF